MLEQKVTRKSKSAPTHLEKIPLDIARSIAVQAQLLDKRDTTPNAHDIFQQLSCIQIDAMQAIRRSQEMVLLARGSHLRQCMDGHQYTGLFETWGHAHSLLPISVWPLFSMHRRAAQHSQFPINITPEIIHRILIRIKNDGPQTLNKLDTAQGKGWERHSPSRWVCEYLLRTGELICIARDRQWRRIYSLAADHLPPDIAIQELTDAECIQGLIHRSIRALGIATAHDIADYFRLSKKRVQEFLSTSDYPQVILADSPEIWYLDPEIYPTIHQAKIPLREDIIPLSPFDSLIWTRSRQHFLFGKDYRLEAYKAAHTREFGYFAMPLLHGNEIIGRIAARRTADHITVEALETDSPLTTAEYHSLTTTLAEWAQNFDQA